MTEKLDLMAAIRAAYPDATQEQLKAALTPDFLSVMHGPMPHYSTLSSPALHNVKTATIGSCVLCYGQDTGTPRTQNKEPQVVIIQRGDKGKGGEPRYGVLGGYSDLGTETTGGEQPKAGATREVCEEAVNDQGKPVFTPDPKRMKLMTSGVDYRVPKLPVAYSCHVLELSAQEMATVKEHCRKLENDAGYRAAVQSHSHREVLDMKVMPLSQALAIPRESFFHPHEYDVIVEFAEHLKQQQTSQKR